jgi:hypothetical protein
VPAEIGFTLISDADKSYKIVVTAAKLYATKVKLNAPALAKYSKLLASHGFNYETDRFQLFSKVVPKSEQNLEWNLTVEKMPKRAIIFQIDQGAYNSALKQNGFNLEKFGLDSFQLFVNDVSTPLNVPIHADRQFGMMMYQTIKAINNEKAWNMGLTEYEFGDFMYAVDLTADRSADSDYKGPDHKCSFVLKLKYKEELKQSIVVFFLTETRATLHIDENRKAKWM